MQTDGVHRTNSAGPRKVFILLAVAVGVVPLQETGTHAATLEWSLTNSAKWAIVAVSIAPYSGQEIGFDSVGSGGGYSTVVSYTHTIGVNSYRLLIVGLSVDDDVQVQGVRLCDDWGENCVAMNSAGSVASSDGGVGVHIYYLANPATGADLIVKAKLASETDVVIGGASLYNAYQYTAGSGPAFTTNSNTTANTTPSITVTTTTELVVDVVGAPNAAGGLTCVEVANERTKLYTHAQSHSEATPYVYTYGGMGTGAESTAVKTISFAATGLDEGVLLEWETATEVDTAGFNVLRAEAGDGPWVTLTQDLIPSRGSSWGGATYAFSDEGREPGTVYWYCVEEVDTVGGTARHPAQLIWDEGLTDADGDRMPDAWERRRGFDPGTKADANADADGDGSTNLEEYLAGTSPVDARDRPRLRIERDGRRNRVSLAWPGRPARTYKLVTADSLPELLGVSPRVLSVMPATSSGPMSLEDVPGAENRMRFYRLIISPPR